MPPSPLATLTEANLEAVLSTGRLTARFARGAGDLAAVHALRAAVFPIDAAGDAGDGTDPAWRHVLIEEQEGGHGGCAICTFRLMILPAGESRSLGLAGIDTTDGVFEGKRTGHGVGGDALAVNGRARIARAHGAQANGGMTHQERAGERPPDERGADERRADERRAGERRAGERRAGERRAGERRAGEGLVGDERAGRSTSRDGSAMPEMAGTQSPGNDVARREPSVDEPTGNEPTGNEPTGIGPVGAESVGAGPSGPKQSGSSLAGASLAGASLAGAGLAGAGLVGEGLMGEGLADGYAATVYDLSALSRRPGPMIEMGRFCIRPGPRDADVLRFAWAVLARIVDAAGASMLFGCASFVGTDPVPHAPSLRLLARRHLAPPAWRPGVQASRIVRFADLGPGGRDDPIAAVRGLPPLLRGYLGLGGLVSDHAVIDAAMGTIHVFTAVEIAAIPSARSRALRALAGTGPAGDDSAPRSVRVDARDATS